MSHEAKAIADYLERIARDIIVQLDGIPDEILNQPTPIPDTNTLFALATHTVGMGEFWVLALVGGQKIDRNRSLEFRASGKGADLIMRFTRWIDNLHQVLDTLPNSKLNEPAHPPAEFATSGGFQGDQPMSCRDCLLHVVEHTATHLGHIQMTRQLFDAIEQGLVKVR